MLSNNNPTSISESISEQILKSVDAYIYTKDLEGRYTYVNQAVLTLFNKELTEVIGYDDSYFFDLSVSIELKKNDLEVMNNALRVESEESNYIISKQETRLFKVIKKPLFDNKGNVTGMCGISTDITDEKKLQHKVNEQKHLLDTILNNIDAHIYMKNSERTFMYVNSRVAELFGDSSTEHRWQKRYRCIASRNSRPLLPSQTVSSVYETNHKQVIEETDS